MGAVIMRLYDALWYSYGTASPSHGAFRGHQLGVVVVVACQSQQKCEKPLNRLIIVQWTAPLQERHTFHVSHQQSWIYGDTQQPTQTPRLQDTRVASYRAHVSNCLHTSVSHTGP